MRRLCCFLALASSGCATIEGTVRDRMAIDTGCAPEAIAVTQLPGSAYRATGCGQVATYVCTTPHDQIACTKEAPSEPVVPPPPPPAGH